MRTAWLGRLVRRMNAVSEQQRAKQDEIRQSIHQERIDRQIWEERIR